MTTRRHLLLGAVAAPAALAGCASNPASDTADHRTYCMTTVRTRRTVCTPEPIPSAAAEMDAKRFEATPGVFTVYVVRSAWADAIRPLNVKVDGTKDIGTLPRSLIRLKLSPGTHELSFEWNGRVWRQAVQGAAGDLRMVELIGSSLPFTREYRWSDADPAGAKLRALDTRLIADG